MTTFEELEAASEASQFLVIQRLLREINWISNDKDQELVMLIQGRNTLHSLGDLNNLIREISAF